MQNFVLRELKHPQIAEELLKVGFDQSYAHKACEKFEYKNIKIYSLTPAQANIIKQTALSVGADCATHREVITGKTETSDCILGGSVSQIKKIAEKLKNQPFGLKMLSLQVLQFIEGKRSGRQEDMPFKDSDIDSKAGRDCYADNKKYQDSNYELQSNSSPSPQPSPSRGEGACDDSPSTVQPLNQKQPHPNPPHLGEGMCQDSLSTFQPFNPSTDKNLPSCPPALMPSIVGILNLTDNSFSDGGMYNDFERAKDHLVEMINDGADIIDIGAESTKPYSSPVSDEEQLKKLIPVIEFAKDKIPLSIDTRSAKVAEECLKAGANIINDVSGFDYDDKMADVISKYSCPVIIQHSKGTPENMQENPQYEDVIEEIYLELYKKCQFAKSKGIENIIIDPGIGFGKTRENNFEIIRRVEEFKSLGYPVMLGISRKSFLGMEDNNERDIYTVAINALVTERKVDFLRVHNVKMHRRLVDLMKMFVVE